MCGEKQIYAYLNEGIVIFNKAFTILYCNNSAVQHLGSDIQGKNIKEFIVANDINKLVNVDQEEKIILNFRTAQGKWVQGKCYLFKQEYMGEMVSTLLIEKYEEKLSWMETKQVLDKLPYLIFIKDINNTRQSKVLYL